MNQDGLCALTRQRSIDSDLTLVKETDCELHINPQLLVTK